jgi:two-component system, NtrC family, response regulator AtoC
LSFTNARENSGRVRVLVVDDDKDLGNELARVLQREQYETVIRQDADAAFQQVLEANFDAVITDLNMKGMTGIELCERIVQNRPSVPVIVVTGFGSMETAVATLRAGAFDFLTKPFNREQLCLSLERALRQRRMETELRTLKRVVEEQAKGESPLLGESSGMRTVVELVSRVATSDATVLITGESGTGKELVARSLHDQSARRDGPLVAINCAAMPEALLESELFGHERGAFTDAKQAKKGLFLEAASGTLFLDEVGEMPLAVQAKLLRALEERKVRPLGSNREFAYDARIVAATNRDLDQLIRERKFREDLFYRINIVHLELPPLRARGTDVLQLSHILLRKLAARHTKHVVGYTPEVAQKLLSYTWPGNVRELQNSLERAVALARFEQIVVDDLPPKVRDYQPNYLVFGETVNDGELLTLDELERRYIARVMRIVGGNKVQATKILGVDRSTLYRKLERYGLEDSDV